MTFDLGGNSGRNFSFGPQGSQPGAHITGTVVDMKEVQETHYDGPDAGKPVFWDNGDPKMQYKLTLQTELRDPNDPNDDGQRNVYLNGYRKPHPKTGTSSTLYAVLEAVRKATGNTQLAPGGKVTLQWVSGMGFTGDPRHYQAWYEAPAMNLGEPPTSAPPAAAPPAQVAQPPAAPPAQQQPPAAPLAQAPVQTEQGPVNPVTGEIAPATGPVLPPGVTEAAVAAVRAAGQDPAVIFPGYQPGPNG